MLRTPRPDLASRGRIDGLDVADLRVTGDIGPASEVGHPLAEPGGIEAEGGAGLYHRNIEQPGLLAQRRVRPLLGAGGTGADLGALRRGYAQHSHSPRRFVDLSPVHSAERGS